MDCDRIAEADCYSRMGDFDKAFEIYNRIIENPQKNADDDEDAHIGRGYIAYKKGDYTAAEADFNYILDRENKFSDLPNEQRRKAHFCRAMVCESLGEEAKAQADRKAAGDWGKPVSVSYSLQNGSREKIYRYAELSTEARVYLKEAALPPDSEEANYLEALVAESTKYA
jgi:tetratricopeptide (TPR) repeat protein